MKNNDYIVVHRDKKPIIIFIKYIVAIETSEDNVTVIATANRCFYVDESYPHVVEKLFKKQI